MSFEMSNLKKISVTLKIQRADEGTSVFYKVDGRRFEYDHSIKMKIQTAYKIILTFNPPQKINSVILRGEELELESQEDTPDHSKYTYRWNSINVGKTKSNKRERFPLIVDVQNVGTLELSLQFKFYGAANTSHSAWGKCLHHIEYECRHKPGNSFLEIVKEEYR